MTGHRGSTSLQGSVGWTKFAKPEDIPDWISKAYADSYHTTTSLQPTEGPPKAIRPKCSLPPRR
jgi:hypothetical protein